MTMWQQVYDYTNLYQAYLRARKEKRYRNEVLRFSYNLEENLIELQNELMWKTYHPGEYRSFQVYEPKQRTIVAAPFRDRVVQHSLNAVMEPVFERSMIHDSYACRKGKGTHEAARRVAYMIGKPENHFYLKADIQGYFPSIAHDELREMFRRRIHDTDVLWLVDQFLGSEPGSGAVGIPIGNLLSQLSANVYLHELDHHIKNELGYRWYVRYMDDFMVFHYSKSELRWLSNYIAHWLKDNLCLSLNRKTRIDRVKNGVAFVGYRIWPGNKLLKKGSIQKMERKARAWRKGKIADDVFLASIGSWIGHARDTASHIAVERILLQALQHAVWRVA